MFPLESPHRDDSNEYSQYTIFNIKKKIALNYPRSAAMGFFFQSTQGQVRNSRGKPVISVRVTEGLLYVEQNAIASLLISRFQNTIKLEPSIYQDNIKEPFSCKF